MQDNQTWIVMKRDDDHTMMPLSDVEFIELEEECLTVMPRGCDPDWWGYIMNTEDGSGIVKTGTFVNCFEYMKKKEIV